MQSNIMMISDLRRMLYTGRDGVANANDNCPALANLDQANQDADSAGDACDNCVTIPGDQTDTVSQS